MYSIYLLSSTLDDKFYVGISNNPERRLVEHTRYSKKKDVYVSRWVNKVIARGGDIKMKVVLSELDKKFAEELEKKVISEFREMDINLTNTAQGGLGFDHTGIPHSEEHKKNLALAQPHKKKIDGEELRDYYVNQKLSKKSIAKIYKCGITTIDRHLKSNKIPIRSTVNYRVSKKLDAKKVIDLYVNKKMSATKISKKFKCSGQSVIKCLRNNGVKVCRKNDNYKKIQGVKQFSKDGVFIKKFNSVQELADLLGKKRMSVYSYIKSHKKCYGYIWELCD